MRQRFRNVGAFYVVEGILTYDKDRDVAPIKARGQNFHTVLGNSDHIKVGEAIVAIGNPPFLLVTVKSNRWAFQETRSRIFGPQSLANLPA